MKTCKSTPKLGTHLNYIKNQQSDIFIQKGLNKPEIEYKHKKIINNRNTFKSSYNFLEWNDMAPHLSPSIKIKQKSKRVKFSSLPKSIYIISCLKNLFLSLINKINNFFTNC